MLRSLLLVLMVAFLMPLMACGNSGGGESSAGPEVESVRSTLRKLIALSMKDDFKSARPYLEVGQYMIAVGNSAGYELDKLSKEDQEGHARSCFNQLMAVKKSTTIQSESALESALSTAKILVYKQTRRAEITFTAMPRLTRAPTVKNAVRAGCSSGM